MDDLASAVERLAKSLESLEQRVAALEQRPKSQALLSVSSPAFSPPPNALISSSLSQESSLLSLFGLAMLAIAGAYLLRAAAEYSAIAQIPIVTLAIVYAFAWLIPAARTKAQNQVASLIWASTSAVICLPMIWELTQRFRILPDALAASILSLYAVVAAILGWKRHFAEIAWVATGSASIAAVALAIARRDLVPFIAALLVMSVVGEIAAARRRKLRVRPLIAAAVDVAVFALITVYSSPAASRPDYPAVSPLFLLTAAPLLLFLYAASASTQTILLRRGISVFETAQTLTAFLLTYRSFLTFWSGRAEIILGMFCLVASAAGYTVSFAWFERVHAQRNYHVYATGSLALLLAGCFLSLPGTWLAICVAVFAVGTSFAARRNHHFSLEFHSLAALAVITVASGLLLWSAKAFAGPLPGAPGGTMVLVTVAAVLCCIAFLQSAADFWWNRLLVLTGAALSVCTSGGLLVWGVVWIGTKLHAAPFTPGPQHVAVIRTFVACAFALGLAWSGSKWQRKELAWLAWTALVLGAVKLLFEDVRHGHLAFTATSIFLYAVTLLLVPRLIRTHIKTELS